MTNVEFVKNAIEKGYLVEAINKSTEEVCAIRIVREEIYTPNYAIAIYCGADNGSDDYVTSEDNFNENFYNVKVVSK